MNPEPSKPVLRSLARLVLISIVAACAEAAPVGPGERAETSAGAAIQAAPDAGSATRVADLGPCDSLRVPDTAKLSLHVYATGAQIYRWTGSAWSFIAPSAVLSADANYRSRVGTHYAGPTWESVSGGKVVGAVIRRCPGTPNAIPWLLLGATPSGGPGVFHDVSFIQRVNTVGGNAPAQPGLVVGEEARVAYEAEYLFYRNQ